MKIILVEYYKKTTRNTIHKNCDIKNIVVQDMDNLIQEFSLANTNFVIIICTLFFPLFDIFILLNICQTTLFAK